MTAEMGGLAVRIRKLKHSCLVIEEGDAKVLIDPGTYSDDFLLDAECRQAADLYQRYGQTEDYDRVMGLIKKLR